MKYLQFALMQLLYIFFIVQPVLSDPASNLDSYMNTWTEKIGLASQYLKDAESEFKNGDELQGCVKQKKAAKYGIEATQSLIKAFEISGSTDDMSNITSGLDKWRELRDFC